jgi:hypothetical protein
MTIVTESRFDNIRIVDALALLVISTDLSILLNTKYVIRFQTILTNIVALIYKDKIIVNTYHFRMSETILDNN